MQGATHFIFDGISSQTFLDANTPLELVSFDNNAIKEVTALSLNLHTRKASRSNYHTPIKSHIIDRMPEHEFSIMCSKVGGLTAQDRKRILRWLIGRNQFKTLLLIGSGVKYSYYNFEHCYPGYQAIFTDAEAIYVNNVCYGFKLRVKFSTQYAMLYKQLTDDEGALDYQMINMFSDGGLHVVTNTEDGTNYLLRHEDRFIVSHPIKIHVECNGVSNGSIEISGWNGELEKFKLVNLASNADFIIDIETKRIISQEGGVTINNCSKDGRYWPQISYTFSLAIIKSHPDIQITFEAPKYIMHGF